jgi:hypothetical protein
MNPSNTATKPSPSLQVSPWWNLWSNPLILRYARSRLRLRHSLGWVLTILILSSFIFFMIYLTAVNRELSSPQDAARAVILPMFMVQGILLMLMGTGSVASGMVQDKISGTLDYQRLTPMNPLAKTIGYLFGLPIREYLLFAITMPFTLFALIAGKISPTTFIPVYAIFFTSVLLYHMTAMAAAMISRRWRFTARLTQGLVILLYLILPHFSHLGLYGFQYLTVRPVLAAELHPLLPPRFLENLDATWSGIDRVPFFIWEFSSFGFSLVLQGLLIVTLGTMTYRKWRDPNQHALSKANGIGVFSLIATMILGNLWPILTRDSTVNLPILGGLGSGRVDEAIGIVLPMILSYALLFAGMWILHLVTPNHHEVLRGWRKVVKLGQTNLGWWRNESPAGLVVTLLLTVGWITLGSELLLLGDNGFFPPDQVSTLDRLCLPLALTVALLSFYAALTSLENRRIFLVLLLGWGLPCLVATFLGSAFQSYPLAIYCAALSPLFLIADAALFLESAGLIQTQLIEYQNHSQNAFWIGLLVQALLIALLLWRWSKTFHHLEHIARSGTKNIPRSLLEPSSIDE